MPEIGQQYIRGYLESSANYFQAHEEPTRTFPETRKPDIATEIIGEKNAGKPPRKECNQLHFRHQITQRLQPTAFFADYIDNFAVRCISYIP